MKKQVFNPYLPMNEYVPDGEPHLFDGRVYIYGSHDKENGEKYCLLDYVCYSAPENDLTDWHYEGVIYRRIQDPHYDETQYLYAPDVCKGTDGRYYLYYVLSGEFEVAVAVCNTPCGEFQYLGRVCCEDGSIFRKNAPFDPAVLCEDGEVWLYYGFVPPFPMHRKLPENLPGATVVRLGNDMITVKSVPEVILPGKKNAAGTEFEGHAFFEACSIRKINGLYILIYASELSHELCYAYSQYPDREFHYGGTVISNADIGYRGRTREKANGCVSNNHGGLVNAAGQWYVFYHRHTHGTQFSRQGCAEPVEIGADGRIAQVEITSCGLNGGPLRGEGAYSAAIACNLYGTERGVTIPYMGRLENQPYIAGEKGEYRITHFGNSAVAGFKYFEFDGMDRISVTLRGCGGTLRVSDGECEIAEITLNACEEFTPCTAVCAPMHGIKPIYLTYCGDGEIEISSIAFSKT
ncbi:MAG: family 43 glycosylhydrolase [Lachnospiraceae bacterium]|nr:family 43 glycosylhydrolase [Lachnospiraceae bacterium]